MTFPVVLDIETTGLDFTKDEIRGIGLHSSNVKVFLTDLGAAKNKINELKESGAFFVMQNGKFDVKFLKRAGIHVECAFDTLVAAYLLEEKPTHSLSLDSLAAYYLGLPSWKGDFKDDWKDIPITELASYCLTDCQITYDLHKVLQEKLVETGRMKFFERLMEASRMLTDVEYIGMGIDIPSLKTLKSTLIQESTELEAKLNEVCAAQINKWQQSEIESKASKCKDQVKALERYKKTPPVFNWASPKQVLWLLKDSGADVMKWNQKKRTKVESSSDEVLQNNQTLNYCALLMDLRERTKLVGALEGYEEVQSKDTGRIHCNFNVTTTDTGRLSSSKPNLQNVDTGKRVRSLFVPREGYPILVGDMAQIEVRMAAHYSRDPKLMEMFQRGEDFYGTIACEILNANCLPNEVKTKYPKLRSVAKVIGLSILYGVGPNRLRDGIYRSAGIEYSPDDARGIIRRYFERFEGLKDLRIRVERAIAEKGHIVSLFGRPIDISYDDIYMHGVNYLLQSSASDLLLFRQVEINKQATHLDQDLVSLVHDEFLRECHPKHVEELKRICKAVLERTEDIEFRVPLKVEMEVGANWGIKN